MYPVFSRKPIAALLFLFCCGCHTNNKADRPPLQTDSLQSVYQPDSGWMLPHFVKLDSANPVLGPGNGQFRDPITNSMLSWEEKDVFNPAIVVRNNKIYMLYRAQDRVGKPDGTSRIGLATSEDGIHFTRNPAPVLYPDHDAEKKYEWEGGCEDPRIVEDDKGTYYMTYTGFDGKLARLLIATSTDLLHWTKKGLAFGEGTYRDAWSKSGSIVSEYKDGRIIARKIAGNYWMYWGDQNICLARSNDLIHWTPVEMEPGEKAPIALRGQALNWPQLRIALPTRSGRFDSDLVESGPPAMYTDRGILLIYNSRNIPAIGDSSLPEGTYAASQALFDKNDPGKLIGRMDRYFMKPDKPYEISGQVNRVCFVEGLARFKNAWWLYYGTADSKIAVAVAQ